MKKIVLLLICLIIAAGIAACPGGDGEPESLVITPPTVTTYAANTAAINLDGGKVAVKYTKGKVKDEVALDAPGVTIMPYSLDVVGTVEIEVKYKDLKGIFEVEVVSPEGVESISVTKAPLKTSYGPKATVANVERRGGELTVKFSDSSKADLVLDLAHPDVTVQKIDFVTNKVTVNYMGILADYTITPNNNEIGFITFKTLPTRTSYRNTATAADVDFTGAVISLTVDGSFIGEKTLSTWGGITITEFDEDLGFVAFRRTLTASDISSSSFHGKTVEGTFDIKFVDRWVESFIIEENPDAPISPVTKLEGYNLAGGVAKLKFNDNDTENLSLTDSKFSLVSFSFDEKNMTDAHVVVEYLDDVVVKNMISATIDTTLSAHNLASEFEYYHWLLPNYSEGIWSTRVEFSKYQRDMADAGFKKWIDANADTRKDLGDAGKEVVLLKYYADRQELYYENFDELDRLVGVYRDNSTKENEDAIKNHATEMNKLYTAFQTNFTDVELNKIVLYKVKQYDPVKETEVETTVTFENNRHNILNYCKNNLKPFLSDDVFTDAKALLAIFDSVDWSEYDTSEKIRALNPLNVEKPRGEVAQKIEAAYALINSESKRLGDNLGLDPKQPVPRQNTSARQFTYILTGEDFFPEALDIIYAYYYDPALRVEYMRAYDDLTTTNADLIKKRYLSATNNKEIFFMLEDGVVAPLVQEAVDYVPSPLHSLSNMDNIRFLRQYEGYKPLMAKIKTWKYESTKDILNGHRTTVQFYPDAIPSLRIKDKPAVSGWKSNMLEFHLEHIKMYYNEVLYQYYGEMLNGDGFNAFFPGYTEFFLNWTQNSTNPSPYPVGNPEFDAGFETIFTSLRTNLTFGEQGAFFDDIDLSAARSAKILNDNKIAETNNTSGFFFGMMMEAYLASRLNAAEMELHYQVMKAYKSLAIMAYTGIGVTELENFIRAMDSYNEKNLKMTGTRPAAFNNYTLKLLEVCNQSIASLKSITDDEMPIIENLQLAMSYRLAYKLSKINVLNGLSFLTYLDDLDKELEIWADKGNSKAKLDTYKIGNEISIAGQVKKLYEDLSVLYEGKVKKHDGNDFDAYLEKVFAGNNTDTYGIAGYANLIAMGKKYVRHYNTPDYVDSDDFIPDIEAVIAEYNSIAATELYRRLEYFDLGFVALLQSLQMYYSKVGAIQVNAMVEAVENVEDRAEVKAKLDASLAAEAELYVDCLMNYYYYQFISCLIDEEWRGAFGYISQEDLEKLGDADRLAAEVKYQDYLNQIGEIGDSYFAAMKKITTKYEALHKDGGEGIVFEIKSINNDATLEVFYQTLKALQDKLNEDYGIEF